MPRWKKEIVAASVVAQKFEEISHQESSLDAKMRRIMQQERTALHVKKLEVVAEYIKLGGTKNGLRSLLSVGHSTAVSLWNDAQDRMHEAPIFGHGFKYEPVEGKPGVYWNTELSRYQRGDATPVKGKFLIFTSEDADFSDNLPYERVTGLEEWPPAGEVKP